MPSLAVGPNVNVTKLPGSQAESTVSINPTNSQNLFESDTVSRVGHYSLDGGATWQVSNLGGLPPSMGDVQTAWDAFGNLYLSYLTPHYSYVVVVASTNGGASFTTLTTTAISHANADQPCIAAGPGNTPGTQSVWVSWTDAYSGSFAVVAAGAQVTGLGAYGTFTTYAIPGSLNGDFGDVAIGPAGQVLVTYQYGLGSGGGPDTLVVNTNPAGVGGAFGPAVTVTATQVGGHYYLPAQPSRTTDAEANLAWDRSGGPHNGRAYLVYCDAFGNPADYNTDILVRTSDDNGATWGAPVRVNDDATTRSQFLPAIALDQTSGNVAVTWYDGRNSAANTTVQVFGSVSGDGGATFTPNVQVSAGTTDATVPAAGSFNLGDFDKMDFRNNVFYRTWADNSNSTGDNPDGAGNGLDVYTAAVTFTPDNRAPVVTPAPPQSASELAGQPFDLGSFTDPDGGPWSVDVNWGDGTPHTTFTVAQPGALGSQPHTYAEDGTYPLTVTVTDGTNLSGSAVAPVAVSEPPLTISPPVSVFGKKVKNAVVAVFTHANGLEPASAFAATIDWGDHTTSPGAVSLCGTTYLVKGSHVYARGGRPHTVTTTVTEVGETPAASRAALPGSELAGAGQLLAALLPGNLSSSSVPAWQRSLPDDATTGGGSLAPAPVGPSPPPARTESTSADAPGSRLKVRAGDDRAEPLDGVGGPAGWLVVGVPGVKKEVDLTGRR